jgi:HK97 family phage prohead protease
MRELTIVRKTHEVRSAGDDPVGMEFILSDASVDRYGDTIDANGWVLDNFSKNPIALFNHQSSFPIGLWSNLRVQDNALRGHLKMAPAGTSPRHDELRALIDAKILKAVSVGFVPLDSAARKDDHGYYIGENYVKQELIETSLVSVPANPNALAVAKSLRISDDTMGMVFAKHGSRTMIDRAVEGDDTAVWQGVRFPVKRFENGTWRGEKLYRY